MPSIYLPSYARSLVSDQDVSSTLTASLPLILLSTASVLGCVLVGFLSDRYHIAICILASSLGSTVAVFTLWGTATTLPKPLRLLSRLWPLRRLLHNYLLRLCKSDQEVRQARGCGLGFCLVGGRERGIGSVVSGPLSGALLQSGEAWPAALGYRSGYGAFMVFVGVTSLLGGISFPGMLLGRL